MLFVKRFRPQIVGKRMQPDTMQNMFPESRLQSGDQRLISKPHAPGAGFTDIDLEISRPVAFIDLEQHQGMTTFVFMAIAIAVLGFLYCFGVVLITHTMAERIRANPKVSGFLQKLAGVCLIGFGLKLAVGK